MCPALSNITQLVRFQYVAIPTQRVYVSKTIASVRFQYAAILTQHV
ncbi:unnamed protein product [Ectocarpus sp. CCAP 1310/34]|nr:unnamed protein product [Ectocarpus sp. CCAP 1310/34]